MLHIVSSAVGFSVCKASLKSDDVVLFLGDGVYAQQRTLCAQTFVLSQDADARGIITVPGIQGIDYEKFVELVVSTPSSSTWK